MAERWEEALRLQDDAALLATLSSYRDPNTLIPRGSRERLEWSLLHAAASAGRAAATLRLLERGADPNLPDRHGTPPLCFAVTSAQRSAFGDPARVIQLLLDAGARRDVWSPHGHLIHLACEAGLLDLVKTIDVSVNLRVPRTGVTPLLRGAAHLSIVEWLLARGASTSAAEASPLGRAVGAGRLDCARLIHAAGGRFTKAEMPEIVREAVETSRDRLEIVIGLGAEVGAGLRVAAALSPEQVRTLLEHGADATVRDDDDKTFLDLLSEEIGDLDELEDESLCNVRDLLADAGARRTPGDQYDAFEPFMPLSGLDLDRAVVDANLPADTAAMTFAVAHGTARLVRHFAERGAQANAVRWEAIFDVARLATAEKLAALLDAGLDPNRRGGAEDDPLLHGPVDFHLHDEVEDRLRLLLDAGAEVDARNGLGWTPLMRAAAGGHAADFPPSEPWTPLIRPQALALLVERGARVDAVSTCGTTLLHAACAGGVIDLAKRAVEAGAGAGAANDYLRTPLHEAARGGHLEIVRWLCELGVDLNARDAHGESPLHLALHARNEAVANELIARGAAVDLRDVSGTTPLSAACRAGTYASAAVLVARGADVGSRDALRRTPLHHCSSAPTHLLKILVDAACNGPSDEAGDAGRQRQEQAEINLRRGATACAALLLDHGAEVNVFDIDGLTPLLLAVAQEPIGTSEGMTALPELLLARGASPQRYRH